MAQRRKMEITVVEENDKGLLSLFQNAANNLSQLYAQAVNLQEQSFEAGKRHSLVKLQEWMMGMLQEGKIVTSGDIYGYLQGELNNSVPGFVQQEQTGGGLVPSGMQPEVGSSSSVAMDRPQGQGNSQCVEMDITTNASTN